MLNGDSGQPQASEQKTHCFVFNVHELFCFIFILPSYIVFRKTRALRTLTCIYVILEFIVSKLIVPFVFITE